MKNMHKVRWLLSLPSIIDIPIVWVNLQNYSFNWHLRHNKIYIKYFPNDKSAINDFHLLYKYPLSWYISNSTEMCSLFHLLDNIKILLSYFQVYFIVVVVLSKAAMWNFCCFVKFLHLTKKLFTGFNTIQLSFFILNTYIQYVVSG